MNKPSEKDSAAPYKVEAPVVEDLADIAIAQRPAPVPVVEDKPAKKPRTTRVGETAAKAAKAADKASKETATKAKAPRKPRMKVAK